jgi:hypothetical protein
MEALKNCGIQHPSKSAQPSISSAQTTSSPSTVVLNTPILNSLPESALTVNIASETQPPDS